VPRNLPARCVGLRASAARVGRASVSGPAIDRPETRERSRAEPQRRGRGSTKKDGDIFYGERQTALHLSQSTHPSHLQRVRGAPCARSPRVSALRWVCLTAKSPDHVSNANTISCSSLHYSVIRVWCTYRQVSEARRSVTSQDRTPLLVIHNTHSRGLSRCVVPWQRHPVLAIDGFTTHTSRSLPSSPLPPGRGAARRPVEDLPARTRHRVQDLVQATADNHRRTGQATRRERYHTEPGIARDGRACARLATAGGPPRGAPARMASCRRGRHESGFGALVAKARSGRARTWKRLCTPRAGRYLRRQPSKRAW
jgi:hypothetical protein